MEFLERSWGEVDRIDSDKFTSECDVSDNTLTPRNLRLTLALFDSLKHLKDVNNVSFTCTCSAMTYMSRLSPSTANTGRWATKRPLYVPSYGSGGCLY